MAYVLHMIRALRIIALPLGGLALAFGTWADVARLQDPRYQVILDRNAFGLKPPPPSVVAVPSNPPVKVNVQLSGITEDLFGKKAYFVIPASPGKTTTNQCLTMREGESQGDLKVLEIDVRGRTVKIQNAGTAATLDFANNAPATPPPMAVAPGMPRPMPVPGQPQPAPGIPTPGVPPPSIRTAAVTPGAPQPVNVPGAVGAQSSALQRYSSTPVVGTANVAASVPVDGSSPFMRTIPARNIRTATPDQGQNVDPAVQWLRMKAAETDATARGIIYPPVPPVPGPPE